jgi:hypothetical protein
MIRSDCFRCRRVLGGCRYIYIYTCTEVLKETRECVISAVKYIQKNWCVKILPCSQESPGQGA